MSIELTDELVQTYHHNCSQPHQLVIDDEIEKLLKKNVITRCDNEENAIISPIFSNKKTIHSGYSSISGYALQKGIEQLGHQHCKEHATHDATDM